jgi:hypothetical protein
MNAALDDVLRRRAALVARSEGLRRGLAEQSLVLVRPLSWADRARAVGRWCAQRPLLFGAVVTLATVLRPRRALTWATRAWAGWRLLQRVLPALQSPWKPPAR